MRFLVDDDSNRSSKQVVNRPKPFEKHRGLYEDMKAEATDISWKWKEAKCKPT
jgi:hypothetical protein